MFAFVIACAREIDEGSVEVEVHEDLPSVATVTWTTRSATRGRVEYGPEGAYTYSTPTSQTASERHRVDVVGLPPECEWTFRVVAVTSTREFVGADHRVSTPAPPLPLPELTQLESDGGASVDWVLASYMRLEPGSGVMIVDGDGQIVWYWTTHAGSVTAARWTADGRSVLIRVDTQEDPDLAQVAIVALDGSSLQYVPTPGGHHAVAAVDVPGVRFAYVALEVREWEGEPVVGDRIVEVGEDGTEREVWNAFERMEVVRHEEWHTPYYEEGADWTHANGLSYDNAEDAYYLSLYRLDTILKIDRASGETIWALGGASSDFAFAEDRAFSHPHSPSWVDGSLYLFDNSGQASSQGAEYVLDTDAWVARRAWEWGTPEADRVTVLGDVSLLPDDQVLTAWGDVGQLNVVGRDLDVRWRVQAEPGVLLGSASGVPSLYPD